MTKPTTSADPVISVSYAHMLSLVPETLDLLQASGAFNRIADQLDRPNMLRAYRCILDQSRAALRPGPTDDEATSILQAHALTQLSVQSCSYMCAAAHAAEYKNEPAQARQLAKTATLMYQRAFSDERYLRMSASLWLPSVADFYTKVSHLQPVQSDTLVNQLYRALPGNPQVAQIYAEIKQHNFKPVGSNTLQ